LILKQKKLIQLSGKYNLLKLQICPPEVSVMSHDLNHLKICLSSLFSTLLIAVPVLADDTEIYIGQNQGVNSVAPNVLFVLDTSGSMRSLAKTITSYDPAIDYSVNPGACFSNSRVYTSKTKSCNSNNYFNASAFVCEAAIAAFSTTGFYNDRFARWNRKPSKPWKSRWKNLNNNKKNELVECKSDNGIHGSGGSKLSIANGTNGPWTNNNTQILSWSNLGSSATLYSGNYLNWYKTSSIVFKTRLEVMKEVMSNVVNSVQDINIGLMRFDRGHILNGTANAANGGMVVNPVEPIATNRSNFTTALNAMTAEGYTPLSEVLYEAAQYYQGNAVDYGDTSFTGIGNPSGPGQALRSHPDSRTPQGGAIYKSPINYKCQKNFVVLLSDGAENAINLGRARLNNVNLSSCNGGTGSCLDKIASYMGNVDQSSSFVGKQDVSTYTIGFATNQTLLNTTAQASKNITGSGEYFTADNSDELTDAFLNIITNILGVSATFSSPAVSVNAFNRTSHRQDLYFTLFEPSTGPHWDGNFKRYKLNFKLDGSPEIVDVNDQPAMAVNPVTGFFSDTATSYWTTAAFAPDGKNAPVGGAVSRLSNRRTIYTDIAGVDLTISGNLIHENNSLLDMNTLGLPTLGSAVLDQAYRSKLLQWARGIDVDDDNGDGSTTDARLTMGDPLHSQPALIQYGGTNADPDITAYVATNDGYLHAIDTRKNSGKEIFAYVPNQLLGRLGDFYKDNSSQIKPYGLDGSVVAWVNDKNRNGIIDPVSDQAYIYFGMRRGGKNLYAMDVTDRANPKMLWTIAGGSPQFTEMGQSWSKPVLRKIKVNGVTTMVLVFAGGYDTNQDNSSLRSTDSVGRAVYMVDATTGKRLWWAAHDSNTAADIRLAEMQYSMPSDLSAVDVNADGFLDVIYAADMGGQIFRFDFPGSEVSNADGGRIAELAKDTLIDSRRFYYQPDVTIIKNRDRTPALALVISSGYRSHPNDQSAQDRIYMIRDNFPITGVSPVYSTITGNDLFDTTDNLIGEGNVSQKAAAVAALNGKKGWYIDLEKTGEKGLSKAFIYDNKIFISTFIPSNGVSNSCAPSEGTGLVYIMNLHNAAPPFDLDPTVGDSKNNKKGDRNYSLRKGGIPSNPVLIMNKNQKDVICVGTECTGIDGMNKLKSEYWWEQ
jgi:type IV pilus assembly protein PilY1